VQRVWFRSQIGWWYASVKEGGTYKQFKLVKAPNDRAGRKLAEAQLIQECRRRRNSEALGRPLGGGAIVRRTTVQPHMADCGMTTSRMRGAPRCTPIWTNGPRSAVAC
jgi:hypothetical protein